MPFPYNGNIPQPTDILSVSQPEILQNFTSIQSLVDVDHADFANANAGQHNKVSLPVQAAAPAFAAGTNGFFNLLSAVTGVNEVNISKQLAGTGNSAVAMTSSILSTNGNPGTNSVGWSLLPSGILLKWGPGNVTSTGLLPVQPFLFPVGPNIPVFTTVFNCLVTLVSPGVIADPNQFINLVSYNNLGMQLIGLQRLPAAAYINVQFQYLAIGF